MAKFELKLPKMGESVAEATVTNWLKKVGDKIILRIDANQGWSFNDAIKCLDGMLNLNIEFCEQPMRTWYDDRLPELKQKTNIAFLIKLHPF